jgi:quaternary ammonium compound-resistance protein SugE
MLLLYKSNSRITYWPAYAVWTGIGAVGTVLVGIVVFKEPATFGECSLTTLITSIVGLKFVSSH